jgi:site-specific recombinase XerD
MQVRRTDGRFDFDFTFEGRRVRRVIECAELVRFLEGGAPADLDVNLGPGKEPTSFYDFVYDYYLPLHSEARKKPAVYKTDRITMKSLARYFGDEPLHRIQAGDWEEYKKLRLAQGAVPARCRRLAERPEDPRARRLRPGQKASPWTVNRELSGLNQVLEYALSLRLIKENPVRQCARLPAKARKEFWLRKDDVELFLRSVPAPGGSTLFRHLAEFLVLTGARIGEALLFNARQVDWQRREIELATFKKRGKERAAAYRYLSIDSLGPRFISLLRRMTAHPRTGSYFAGRRGEPLPYSWVYKHLARGGRAAGFDWLRPHDLRHTFAMHRAMAVRDFRRLQMELGQEDPASIQSYLDNTARMRPEDSLFRAPPGPTTLSLAR